ncbi:MAG TPA: dTDP-4-dehydrorhamnose reductase [Planctomycetota bacterium]|nr:dTDP-4-dehydrorhamnose reductase [Planctomycetota bacterium]
MLLTGGKGMLGRTLCSAWKNEDVIPTAKPNVDIMNYEQVASVLEEYKPDVVVHCAAMTNVDNCESQQDLAYAVNAYGTQNVARACHYYGIRLIAISTDYVFDGLSKTPYHEFHKANGGNTVYGKSKFAGEEQVRCFCPNHVIVRVSWLYGTGGPSFVHSMVKLASAQKDVLKVVNDQIGNPTSTMSVARKLHEIIARPELAGTFHLTCEGEATWYEFAQEIFAKLHIQQNVVPCTTHEFPRPAPRPNNSRLDKMMLRIVGLSPMPHWRVALAEFLEQEFPKNDT